MAGKLKDRNGRCGVEVNMDLGENSSVMSGEAESGGGGRRRRGWGSNIQKVRKKEARIRTTKTTNAFAVLQSLL